MQFLRLFLATSAVVAVPGEGAAASPTYGTVAFSGADGTARGLGPRVESGVHFSSFQNPVISQAGDVAVVAFLDGPDISADNGWGVWTDAAGPLEVIARVGPQGPGPNISGLQFKGFYFAPPNISDAAVVLGGLLTGPGVVDNNAHARWAKPHGDAPLTPYARSRDSTYGPGLGPGVTFSYSPGAAVMNRSGFAVFDADLTGTGIDTTNRLGIWSYDAARGGRPTLLARAGPTGPGPGLGPGVDFQHVIYPIVNDAGTVAFFGNVTGTGIDPTNRSGVWVREGGVIAPFARTGAAGPGPGIGPGVTFSSISAPLINAAGTVAFSGLIVGDGVDSSNEGGIWAGETPGALRLVARTGAAGPGPGLGVGVHFEDVHHPLLTNGGHVVFPARLTGAGVTSQDRDGTWVAPPGTPPRAVARTGPAGTAAGLGPGAGPGIYFRDLNSENANAAGQVAVRGWLGGVGITAANDSGIWAYNGATLQQVVREGELFDVDPSAAQDLRQIKAIDFGGVTVASGGGDGRPMFLNDAGRLAFQLTFADDSEGLFTAQLYLPGDANRDLSVNGSDFALLAGNFGRTGQTWSTGDFNGDAAVNGTDFALLAGRFGQSLGDTPVNVTAADYAALAAFGATVPEPSAALCAALAAGLAAFRRPGRRRMGWG